MVKKTKNSKRTKRKNHGWQKYFFLLFVGIISFIATTVILQTKQPQINCANSQSCTSDLSEKIENNTKGMFQGQTVFPPSIDITRNTAKISVLGTDTASGEKHIYIDLSTQKLYAYQGKTLVLDTFISSGKWNKTPVGNFHIWTKFRATRMSGGQGEDAYNLPNVPYVLYFYHDFGLHGAYWHNNFGHPMSHGCINMRIIDAKVIYDWADGPSGKKPGTAVSICEQITKSHECIQNNPIQ